MNTGIPMRADLLASPEYARRMRQFRQAMQQAGQDAALIFAPQHLRYLLNYAGEAATALVSNDQCYLITDYRFEAQARQETVQAQPQCQVLCRDRDRQSLGALLGQLLADLHCNNLWFEADQITVQLWQQLLADLQSGGNGHLLRATACPPVLAGMRMIKDDYEVSQIQQAAAIADSALAQVLGLLKPGIREHEFATELEYQLKKRGADELSFATIVGFGARSALPHALPGDKRLQKGDLVLVDFGAAVNGYRSDMTRSYVAGKPDVMQQALYQTVRQAQQAALARLKAGVTASSLFQVSDQLLQQSEFGRFAGPGLGHGVGLQLHEQPFLSPNCHTPLQSGMVVTIEPGLYLPNYGGVRLEDDVLVTERGYSLLTQAPSHFELVL